MTQADRPDVTGFFDQATNTIAYIVADPRTQRCAVIDTVLGFDPVSGHTDKAPADAVIAEVRRRGLTAEWVLETHVHADHLSAAPYVQAQLGGRLGIGAKIRVVQDVFGKAFNAGTEFARDGSQFDRLFADGDTFAVGAIPAHVIETPGHTPACVTYVIGDACFVGDTLFMPDYGSARCDFPGGDARQLYRSVQRIFALPDSTRMFLCHDYLPEGRATFQWETSVGEQKAHNIHLHEGVTEDAFVAMRTARDAKLSLPKLIIPSVQVNMRGGRPPPPEENGVRYLKVPLDTF